MLRATIIWVLGLLTFVPYASYHLLFYAPREQYALLITGVLFWIFGYWGVVGPALAAWKVRTVFRALERAQDEGRLKEALHSDQAREVAIDYIATENGLPRVLAARVYALLVRALQAREARRP